MRINQLKSRRNRNQAGVTLLEAVVSMGIFGVSFFSLYAGMSLGVSVIGNARENLRATQVLVEKMETIRLYSWDQINTPGFIPATFSESYYPDQGGGGQSNQSFNYSGTVTVANGPGGLSYSADMRSVTITLTWRSGGHTHNRSLTTYVSRNGLQNYIY